MGLPALNEAVERVLCGRGLVIAKPSETILLRDKEGLLLDYKDDPTRRKMRIQIASFNEAIEGADISGFAAAPMVRIYNRTFGRGGRFYALGGGWQSMPKPDRQKIQIEGEPVVEIDYKTLHPAILYAQAKAALPEDSYSIGDWPRSLVKRALLILINAKNRPSARLAIAHGYAMTELAIPGSQEAIALADRLIDDIARVHKPIAWAFHSDKGAELMQIDSNMAAAVMQILNMAGIVVLPVHDSFLVQESKAGALEEAMYQVAYEVGLESIKLDRS